MINKPVISQNMIMQYDECPFKAYLQYTRGVDWTGYDEKKKDHLDSGNMLHRLVQCYFSDIPCQDRINDQKERLIFKNLSERFPKDGQARYFSERKLTVEFDRYYLSGIIDLIEVKNGKYRMADWKLGNIKRNIGRYDTQAEIYMYLISYNIDYGTPIIFEFCNIAGDGSVVRFEYDWSKREEFGAVLSQKIERILTFSEETFEKEAYRDVCETCIYRKICE